MNHEGSLFPYLLQLCAQDRGLSVNHEFVIRPVGVDQWPLLLAMAQQHKVSRSVYRASLEHGTVQDHAFQKIFKITTSMQAAMASQWQKLEHLLHQMGIQSLVIKGPALSAQLYDDATVRGFTDLDVIIDAEDLEVCIPVFHQAGFTLQADLSELSARHPVFVRFFVQSQVRHLVFTSPKSPCRIEVHNKLLDFTCPHMQEHLATRMLMQRSTTVQWQGISTRTLAMVDHALLMIDHGTKHGWCLLHWVLDAAAFLAIDDTSLHMQVATLTVATNRTRHVDLMVALVQSLCKVSVPEPYLPLLRPNSRLRKIQLKYVRNNLKSGGAYSMSSFLRHYYGYKFMMASSWRERLALVVKPLQVSPVDMQRYDLPRALVFLHLLFRPAFLFQRHVGKRIVTPFKKNQRVPSATASNKSGWRG